jgi:hypothetical protein
LEDSTYVQFFLYIYLKKGEGVKKISKKNRNRLKVKGLVIAFLLSLVFSAVVFPCAYATSMWSQTYGGTGSDSVEVFIQTSDGGYAIAGYTNSFGAGSYDFWLVKTDADGNMQWNRTYGGSDIDYGFSVVQTSDGGYALAGTKNNDFWLIKTDEFGNMQWNRTYGGSNNDWAFSVVQTSDGGYAMEGVTTSFGAGGRDGWLVKTDAAGNMQWNKTIGGTDNDFLYSLVTTDDGGYAVGGHTYSFGAGAEDYWLVKTDADGNIQWNQTYGGTGTDFNYRLIRTADGGYAMAGYTNSFGAGGRDCWLVKTDALGNMQWNQTYGGTGDDYGSRVLQTADGGYAVIGYTGSFGAGGQDFYVVKTDAAGNVQWNQTYGGTGNEQGEMLIQTIDGEYTIAGNTNSFGAGGQDFYVVKIIPEGLTIGVMLLLSTVAAIVGIRILRKRPKRKDGD